MDPLVIVVVLALIATIITLFLGLLSMSGGESVDRDFGTPLMWARVGLQAFAVALLMLALFLR
jgi:hypothetical protein